jgi:hypothetical protein
LTKVTRKSPYAAIPNEAMRDETISIEARGMLALMMGMGCNWIFRSKDLMKRCGVGREKYQRMVRELKDAGYLEVRPKNAERGLLDGFDYVLHDTTAGRVSRPTVEPPDGKAGHIRNQTPKKPNLEESPIPPEGADDLFSEKSEQTKPDSQADLIEQGFTEFWNTIWPTHQRKTAKADCRKVYVQACTGKHPKAEPITPQALNAATRRYITSVTDRQFLKAPLAWLRLPGWEAFVVPGDTAPGKRAPMDWSILTGSQRRMLERRECPPSMMVDDKPSALALAYMAEVAR